MFRCKNMLHKMTKYLTIFLFCFLTACVNKPPKDINEAVAYFEKHWSDNEKDEFKNKSEKKAVIGEHFAVGMWIRNEWIRGEQDTTLTNQFIALGIHHPDDMSSIILTSLHRKLNNKPLDIGGQIEFHKAYWKPIIECDEKNRQVALENYKSFNEGDSIEILMYVDNGNAVIIECPNNDWEFDSSKDLQVKGVVTDKYFINSETNVFLKVKIDYINFPNTKILMEDVKLHDIYDFHLENLTVKQY